MGIHYSTIMAWRSPEMEKVTQLLTHSIAQDLPSIATMRQCGLHLGGRNSIGHAEAGALDVVLVGGLSALGLDGG